MPDDMFVICNGFKQGEAFSMQYILNERGPMEKEVWNGVQFNGKAYYKGALVGSVLKVYSKEQLLLVIGKEFYNGVGLPKK